MFDRGHGLGAMNIEFAWIFFHVFVILGHTRIKYTLVKIEKKVIYYL